MGLTRGVALVPKQMWQCVAPVGNLQFEVFDLLLLLQVLFQNGAELHLLSRHMLLVLRRIFCVRWEPAPSCLLSAPNSKTQAFTKSQIWVEFPCQSKVVRVMHAA